MKLLDLQRNWDRLGTEDPWWAVLSHRDKRDNTWDIDEFFATGQELIDETMDWLRDCGVVIDRRHALDFGCGPGRLSQALAHHFERVTGVDIAPSMIAIARDVGHRAPNCEFVLNDKPELEVFADESFDFICSYIVLQHMKPSYAERYLGEFARLLKPGGAMVIQLPSEPIRTLKGQTRRVLASPTLQPLLNLYKRLRYRRSGVMEMYGIRRTRIEALLVEFGLELTQTTQCDSAGPNWTSYRYLAIKAPITAVVG